MDMDLRADPEAKAELHLVRPARAPPTLMASGTWLTGRRAQRCDELADTLWAATDKRKGEAQARLEETKQDGWLHAHGVRSLASRAA